MAKKTATDNVTPLHPKKDSDRAKRRVNLLSDVPAIERYLNRIGATAKSPRTATITTKVEGSYDRDDIALIKLAPDGTWHAPESLAPTDTEREEIAGQIGDYQWPVLKKLKNPDLPKPLADARKADPMNVFEFRDLSGAVVMYQQRIDDKDGIGKKYIPWTFWDDDQWRECEPDEPLPLWGLDQLQRHSIVFLHEGAKAARLARKIASLQPLQWKEGGKLKRELPLDNLTAEENRKLPLHPWASELQHVAHLGWIGGAPNPHRTDWSPLRRVSRAIIVSDNDIGGVNAIPQISRLLSQWNIDVYCVRFDSRFPTAFDLGDDFFAPESEGKLWEWRAKPETEAQRDDSNKRYIGPTFRSLLGPATWAVKEIPPKPEKEPKGRGRPKGPTLALRDVFRNQWVVAKEMDPPLYICRWDPSLSYKAETFNLKNRPFSGGAKNLADMMGRELPVDIDSISYEPGRKNKINPSDAELIVRGKRTFNTCTGTLVQPVTGQHYDPQPWLDFIAHLIPLEEERKVVMRWCATLIARPDIRMTFGLLLVSKHHGVGKTTLAHILSVLVGEHNTSWPNESDIVDSQFNSWLARKRLVVCNEIYSGHSWRAYNKLKSAISDTEVNVNEKHVKGYTISNHAHVMLFSNSPRALKMDNDDRRIFMPKVAERKQSEKWWRDFRHWLAGDGYGIILSWANDYVSREGPIGPETHAPMTEAKRRAIRENMDDDQALATEIGTQAIEMARERNPLLILIDRQVQEWVTTKLGMRFDAESPKAIYAYRRSLSNVREGLEEAGLFLAREWQNLGRWHRAYSTFDPISDEGRKAMERWSELVSDPADVARWADAKRPL